MTNPLEQIARSALAGDALITRSLLQDWLETKPLLTNLSRPDIDDPTLIAVSAGLVEVISSRLGQCPPPWASEVGAAPHPIHLLRSASTMRRLREMCEAESPMPLRRRQIFAPANHLETRS
jgi:hypothetical protein